MEVAAGAPCGSAGRVVSGALLQTSAAPAQQMPRQPIPAEGDQTTRVRNGVRYKLADSKLGQYTELLPLGAYSHCQLQSNNDAI